MLINLRAPLLNCWASPKIFLSFVHLHKIYTGYPWCAKSQLQKVKHLLFLIFTIRVGAKQNVTVHNIFIFLSLQNS